MYNLGQYIPRQSPVHRRDPRVKIIAVIAAGIIILHVNAIGLLAATITAIAVVYAARIQLRTLLKTLRPVMPFFVCLLLLYILFTPGRPLLPFTLGPLRISCQGLYFGSLQVWKFLLLVITASILTMTTSPSEITMGLERLLRPFKIIGISSHNVAMMLSLALRFIPTLLDEMNSVKEAQLARGANLNSRRIGERIKGMANLAGPLSLGVFRRCDELVDAMEARGYQQGHRTYLRELVLTPPDYCLIGLIITTVMAVMLWTQ